MAIIQISTKTTHCTAGIDYLQHPPNHNFRRRIQHFSGEGMFPLSPSFTPILLRIHKNKTFYLSKKKINF